MKKKAIRLFSKSKLLDTVDLSTDVQNECQLLISLHFTFTTTLHIAIFCYNTRKLQYMKFKETTFIS